MDTFDGYKIAQQRIAEEAEARTGKLDLRRLGLTELPPELWQLTHLSELELGNNFRGFGDDQLSIHGQPRNKLTEQALQDLACLTNLIRLSLTSIRITSLDSFSTLTDLQTLYLENTQIRDLGPLAKLTDLRTLDLEDTKITDLGPLAKLTDLQTLDLSYTEITDLGPLAKLTDLRTLDLEYTEITDLGPLAKLTDLQTLDLEDTKITDLGPLAKLTDLQNLNLSETEITNLGPLANLSDLQILVLSHTRITDLGPLAKLTSVENLNLSYTEITDLGPLADLQKLQYVRLKSTQVTDLSPLAGLKALTRLDCSGCSISDGLLQITRLDSMRILTFYRGKAFGVPREMLTKHPLDSTLTQFRAYYDELEAGASDIRDVKVLVLGNGRAGKTQLSRALRGKPYEDESKSTHGISVYPPVPLSSHDNGDEAALKIWDFGGQDIYHGTHALFMRTAGLHLLVWAKDTETPGEFEQDGITFRNYPLQYWVDYVRHLSEEDCPALIVQTQCDTVDDEQRRAPASDDSIEALRFSRELHFSARTGHGRGELNAGLNAAVEWLQKEQGLNVIGTNWLTVQRRIEALRQDDGTLPEEWRLLDMEVFKAWHAETGSVTSPESLLTYLHDAGVVFYRKGLFGNRIVLDMGWAFDAIYAVFDRTQCYQVIQSARGRFTRALLETLIWSQQGHSKQDQELFLSLMQSCGICFVYRSADDSGPETETTFVAPDLLPDKASVQITLQDRWGQDPATYRTTYTYALLHPGVSRSLITKVGQEAAHDAVYWRGGVYVYETTTNSRAMLEECVTPGEWAGTITVSTKGPQSAELHKTLEEWIEQENETLGLTPEVAREGDSDLKSERPHKRRRDSLDSPPGVEGGDCHVFDADDTEEPDNRPALTFGAEPFDYCVSYAWGDDTEEGKSREQKVDDLCGDAARLGKRVLRDKDHMNFGDSIPDFMERIGATERVFVFLSDKYLRSPNCAYELYEIWRTSKADETEFKKRVRVYILPGLNLWDEDVQDSYLEHWKAVVEKRLSRMEKHGATSVPQAYQEMTRKLERLSNDLWDIFESITTTLQPRDWDDFVKYGFEDSEQD